METIKHIIAYPLIILFVMIFVPTISLWIIKRFKKYFPTDESTVKKLEELSRDKKLIEKLERYAGATTLLMIVVWLAMLFGMYMVVMTFVEPGSGKDINLTIAMVFVLILMITAMGPAAYISSLITLLLFKLFNRNLEVHLLWDYYSGALKKGSTFNLLEYNRQYGVNLTKFNNFIVKIFTIVFFTIIFGLTVYLLLR